MSPHRPSPLLSLLTLIVTTITVKNLPHCGIINPSFPTFCWSGYRTLLLLVSARISSFSAIKEQEDCPSKAPVWPETTLIMYFCPFLALCYTEGWIQSILSFPDCDPIDPNTPIAYRSANRNLSSQLENAPRPLTGNIGRRKTCFSYSSLYAIQEEGERSEPPNA